MRDDARTLCTAAQSGRLRHVAFALLLAGGTALSGVPESHAAAGLDPAAAQSSPVGAQIRRLLGEAEPGEALGNRWIDAAQLAAIYEANGYAPLWSGSPEASAKAAAVLDVLRDAGQQGLDPARYDYPALVARLDAADPAELAAFDLRLSAAYVAYYGDVGEGMVSPREVHPEEYGYRPSVNPAGLLQAAAASDDAAAWLRLHVPNNRLYADLLQALHTYRRLAAEGGWPVLPEGAALEPGDADDRVPVLRARLRASGDLAVDDAPDDPAGPSAGLQGGITPVSLDGAADPRVYDAALAQAVRSFQARHGLEEDGVLGPRTVAALNVPVEERIAQILINLERVRWMPGYFGDRYILANTAGYSVEVVEAGRTVLHMAAIVGEDEWQTPAFSDVMTFLEFNPYWNIPTSIAQEEIAGKVRADPGYLARNSIRVLDSYEEDAREFDPAAVDWSNVGEDSPYRLRQDPGPDNPLGDVKFMFPNPYFIYLHDTPGEQLFEETSRAFSHGCIRVSQPLELAAYLLRGQAGWTAPKIAEVMQGDARQVVDLERTIPVHLTYLTAWVDSDGRMQFRDDVYGRDPVLAEALQEAAAQR